MVHPRIQNDGSLSYYEDVSCRVVGSRVIKFLHCTDFGLQLLLHSQILICQVRPFDPKIKSVGWGCQPWTLFKRLHSVPAKIWCSHLFLFRYSHSWKKQSRPCYVIFRPFAIFEDGPIPDGFKIVNHPCFVEFFRYIERSHAVFLMCLALVRGPTWTTL